MCLSCDLKISHKNLNLYMCIYIILQAYPDPDYKLNKSTISEAVFNERDGDSALTYSSLCPTIPVMVNWRELRAQISQLRSVN